MKNLIKIISLALFSQFAFSVQVYDGDSGLELGETETHFNESTGLYTNVTYIGNDRYIINESTDNDASLEEGNVETSKTEEISMDAPASYEDFIKYVEDNPHLSEEDFIKYLEDNPHLIAEELFKAIMKNIFTTIFECIDLESLESVESLDNLCPPAHSSTPNVETSQTKETSADNHDNVQVKTENNNRMGWDDYIIRGAR